MTQIQTQTEKPDAELIQAIKDNPDLFQRYPQLLELVTLSDTRGTASLLEKQVAILKQRLAQFQSQQFELIEVARENEQISDSFSAIICQLIGFENLSEFASEFPAALRKTFAIDEVAFKTSVAAAKRPDENPGYEDALRRLVNNQAVCDNRWPSAIMQLFFSDAVKSAALIPMRTFGESEPIGILALGAADPERYTPELGTDHLDRLGLMAGICIHRLQPGP